MPRGRPRRNILLNTISQENKMSNGTLPKVHHIMRYLSKTGNTIMSGAFSIADADAYLSEWIDKGYELFSTHFVDQNAEGFGVLYILVLKEV